MTRLRIILHNVLSWETRKFDLINTYRRFDPDIILLTSHGLKTDSKLTIPGYRVYKRNTDSQPMDGVAIAIKTRIVHRIDDDFLSETLAVTTHTTDEPVTIATSYLPPRRPYLPHPDFLRLLRRETPVFIAGDLNARHPTLGTKSTNTVGRDLIQYLRHRTARHIGPQFPTYYGPLTATSPDIILTNSNNFLFHSIIPGPLTSSDHIPVIMDISTSPILTPTTASYVLHRTDWDAFQSDHDLQMTDHPDVSYGTLEDIDDALDRWTRTVKDAVARHVPQKTYRKTPGPRPSRNTILTQIQFQALRDRAARTGWTTTDYRRYTLLRQTLHELRRTEATTYWGRTVTDLTVKYKRPRQFWNRLKTLSGQSKQPNVYLIDDNGQKHHTDREKERLFTSIWEQVFRDNDDDDADADQNIVHEFMLTNSYRITPHHTADPARLTGSSHLDCSISTEELRAAVSSAKETSPGSSGIGKTILMHLPRIALQRLSHIFSAALSAGYFPDGLKGAVMRFIPKAGKSPNQPANYRPISLLEVPGKMLERVVGRRLRAHLEEGRWFNMAQYGFRQGRGTAHAIAVATETLAIHQAEGHRCNLVLRDVSKAFDRVWHMGLKYKILQLELPDPVERLLCDYLADRTARVKVGAHTGPPFRLEMGVPQGSVLSPMLYAVYTRDYPDAWHGLNVQYADDVSQVLFHPGRSRAMLNARTGRDIARVNSYEKRWKIKTNVGKFTVIPTSTLRPATLLVEDEEVEFKQRGASLVCRSHHEATSPTLQRGHLRQELPSPDSTASRTCQ